VKKSDWNNSGSTRVEAPSPLVTSEERETKLESPYDEINESLTEGGVDELGSNKCTTGYVRQQIPNVDNSKGAAAKEDFGNDEYDYYSPYWEPSSKEKELLMEVKKLKIASVANEEIK